MRAGALLFLVCSLTVAQERTTTGTITFTAGPTIYAGIGTNHGVNDSSRAVIRSGRDTVASLRLLAASSRSSSWTIERSSRDMRAGDTIIVQTPLKPVDDSRWAKADTIPSRFGVGAAEQVSRVPPRDPWLSVNGRVSVQYYGVQAEDSRDALAQPGLGVSVRSALRDVPVRLDLYGVHRRSIRGSVYPWDPSSRPDTRLYRFAVEFNDDVTSISAGRIYPLAAPTVSALDGLSISRRMGSFYAGLAGGVEASIALGRDPGNIRKAIVFAGFQSANPWSAQTSVAYARSYRGATLVREVVSLSGSAYAASGFSLFGFGDLDLRTPLYGNRRFEPTMTSLLISGNVRILPAVSLFAGVDASRPVPSAALFGVIPDTLIDRTLRAGVNVGANVAVKKWNWMISLSPRSNTGTFSKEYSATTMVGTYDLLSTGVDLRTSVTRNANAYTEYSMVGLDLRKDFGTMDWRVRGQYSSMTVRQLGDRFTGTLVGADVVVPLSRTLSLTSSLDLWRGSGAHLTVLYVESAWRF